MNDFVSGTPMTTNARTLHEARFGSTFLERLRWSIQTLIAKTLKTHTSVRQRLMTKRAKYDFEEKLG